RDRRAGRPYGVAAVKAVGRVHGNAAHDVVADVGLDLEDHEPISARHLEGLEELRLLTRLELDVDHGADDLGDPALRRFFLRRLRLPFRLRHSELLPQVELTAWVPLTISISSVVMPACRTLFA